MIRHALQSLNTVPIQARPSLRLHKLLRQRQLQTVEQLVQAVQRGRSDPAADNRGTCRYQPVFYRTPIRGRACNCRGLATRAQRKYNEEAYQEPHTHDLENAQASRVRRAAYLQP